MALNTQTTFENHLRLHRRVKHPQGRSVHLDEHGLWGCDEYGCDSFIGLDTQEGMAKAFGWLNTTSDAVHPAEFAY